MRVVDEIYVGGDSKAGVQTLAFNLPNDERVREEKGSKKVMLRNVLRAKYDKILVPIAERVLAADQVDSTSFDAFFAESLHHELSHGLGPGKITLDGRDTEVRLELKDLYSTLEEAKADVMGIYNILALIEKGEIPAELRDTLEATYVAGLFRAARFGVHEAHGRGVISQFNYLLEKGALEVDEEGRFRGGLGKLRPGHQRSTRRHAHAAGDRRLRRDSAVSGDLWSAVAEPLGRHRPAGRCAGGRPADLHHGQRSCWRQARPARRGELGSGGRQPLWRSRHKKGARSPSGGLALLSLVSGDLVEKSKPARR